MAADPVRMSKAPSALDLAALKWLSYSIDPDAFCREQLNCENDPVQRRIMEELADPDGADIVLVASCHGIGKTFTASEIVLWAGCTWGSCRIPCTAPKEDTLLKKLWPEIRKTRGRSSNAVKRHSRWTKTTVEFNVDSPPDAHRWFANAETARDPEGMAGHHEDRVLFIVEEATGVHDDFYPVIMGALSTKGSKLLCITNPTRTSGAFAKMFRAGGDRVKLFRVAWNPRGVVDENGNPVPTMDPNRPYFEKTDAGAEVEVWYSDRPDDRWAQGIVDAEGWDSDISRIRVRGLEPKTDNHSLIPAKMVWDAYGREPAEDIVLDSVVWTWDVAGAGRDRSVRACRKGPLVQAINFTPETNLHLAAQELAGDISAEQPDRVNIDNIGIGTGPVDELISEGYYVNAVNVGLPADGVDDNGDPLKDQYANRRAYYYWRLREDFRDGVICLSRSIPEKIIEALVQELEATEWHHSPSGKIQIIDKKSIRKNIGRSPDVADALMLYYEGEYGSGPAFECVGTTMTGGAREDW